MKLKVTEKQVREQTNKNNRVLITYCNAQTLLKYQNPIYYTCGVYGWNADIYQVNNFTIITGYRYNLTGIKYDYKILKKYEEKARKTEAKYYWDRKKQEPKINKLLFNFLEEITKEE